ncbi:3-hydroxyacyl-CoA dehydrogenase [Hypoxylon trugodes]|uniref:3-hydroxyacyl-CoA dehydrogenase n=1 Tax=Hypoxylon trugodes TaxID=326681 RepID=UPI0021A1A75F|nr:3-hydroxyacyl-CoA dehydrogenase [Hypoxylon trugodes]KAI1384428.1 3-hydroxyacyl-CoA dehydrogenase [Hypoxylon trugodes]
MSNMVAGHENGSDNTNPVPLIYFIDIGLSAKDFMDIFISGRILVGTENETPIRELVTGQTLPDSLEIFQGRIYWTNMGCSDTHDGSLYSCDMDGKDIKVVLPKGTVHTAKQLVIEPLSSKIYLADREGMRVLRCNLDGSELEVLIKAGDLDKDEDASDRRWCVGVAVCPTEGKFYWTQKGPPKGYAGRVFRANIELPAGETAENRSDIECVLNNLPEPIDLTIAEIGDYQYLYWTDRGELPLGNSVNRARLDKLAPIQDSTVRSFPRKDYELLVRDLHDTIGIKVDLKAGHIYVTDLGGALYRFDLDGGNKKSFYLGHGAYSGITILYP